MIGLLQRMHILLYRERIRKKIKMKLNWYRKNHND
jgi:hypothetical protein